MKMTTIPKGPIAGLRPNGDHRYSREQLHTDTKHLTGRMMQWLQQGDRLEQLLAETKLKDVLIGLGILTDKMLLLDGQPTQIIGMAQQVKLDEVTKALATVMQQRGLTPTVTLTERTMDIALKDPA